MALRGQLTTLESSGLILPARFQPGVAYLFRHALIQEAAYQSLVKIDRRMLHQAVGETLERLYPAGLDSPELTPVLARHFAEAGDPARALHYYSVAGRAAAAMYANPEAIEHFSRALDLATGPAADRAAAADLFLRRGRAYELNAQDAEALRNYAAMEAWAVAGGDRSAQLAALAARATIYVKPSVEQNLAQGYTLGQQALALARELGDRPAEAKVLWNLLQYYLALGQNEAAIAHGERALAIAREQDLREQIAYILTDLLKVYYIAQRPGPALAALEEARGLWRELGSLNMLADNLGSTSMLHTLSGHYDQALAVSEEAVRISRQIGNLWNQAYAHYLVDLVHFERGDLAQALAVAEAGLQLSQQAGFAEGINQAYFDLALIHGYLGALPRALEYARAAQANMDVLSGTITVSGQVEGLIALIYLLNGRLAEAQAALEASPLSRDPAALQQQFILTQYLFAQVQVELALARRDPEAALAEANAICQSLRQADVRLFLSDAQLLRGRALRAAGQPDAAQQALEATRAGAEEVGSRRSLWQILAELAALAAERGDQPAAQALASQAADLTDYIAAHAGTPDRAASFLNRPQVQAVRSQAARPPTPSP